MRYAEDNHLDFFIKLALLDCGGKDAKMFDEIDDSQVILSARLDRKIKSLIRRSQRSFAAERRKRVFVRISVAAMLIMSLLFAALISITAVREAIWEALVEWHENYVIVRFEDPDNKPSGNGGNGKEDDSQDNTISPPTKIEDVRVPAYVVEGAVEDVFQSMIKVSVDYYRDDSFLYSFVQKILTDRNIYVNNDGAITEELDINGELGTLVTYSDKSETILIWSDQEYVYSLYTTELDTETLVKIALSVKSVTSASPTTPTKIEEVRKPTYVIEGVI